MNIFFTDHFWATASQKIGVKCIDRVLNRPSVNLRRNEDEQESEKKTFGLNIVEILQILEKYVNVRHWETFIAILRDVIQNLGNLIENIEKNV